MEERRSIQERLESSPGGRTILSVVLVFTLIAIVVTNLPDSYVKRRASEITQPYLNATGFDQNWGVFAPDPRRDVIELEGRLVYPDGTQQIWHHPHGSALIGAYRDHRWLKFAENAIADVHEGDLWRPTALYVLRQARSGPAPIRIELIRRFYTLNPPGKGPEHGSTQEVRYYELRVTPRVLREIGRT